MWLISTPSPPGTSAAPRPAAPICSPMARSACAAPTRSAVVRVSSGNTGAAAKPTTTRPSTASTGRPGHGDQRRAGGHAAQADPQHQPGPEPLGHHALHHPADEEAAPVRGDAAAGHRARSARAPRSAAGTPTARRTPRSPRTARRPAPPTRPPAAAAWPGPGPGPLGAAPVPSPRAPGSAAVGTRRCQARTVSANAVARASWAAATMPYPQRQASPALSAPVMISGPIATPEAEEGVQPVHVSRAEGPRRVRVEPGVDRAGAQPEHQRTAHDHGQAGAQGVTGERQAGQQGAAGEQRAHTDPGQREPGQHAGGEITDGAGGEHQPDRLGRYAELAPGSTASRRRAARRAGPG